jgi:tRNA (guanosine-2'-O-)-methyltransferase
MMRSTGNNHPREWYEERIAYLSEFMLPEREQVLRNVLSQRTRYMTVCMENTFHPQNASALVRHCDAFGLQDIYTIEELCKFQPNVNIVRGTDKWITFRRHTSTPDAISALRQGGYRIVATTPHDNGIPPERFDASAGRFALVFGTEHAGISDAIIDAADEFIRIPMQGFVESLNVSASAAILIYILSQKVRTPDIAWQLTPDEAAPILFDWMMQTVKDSARILARRFDR